MPNWCDNYLRVFGDKEEITRFREKAEAVVDGVETALSLNNLHPLPKELEGTESTEKNNWYDWQIQNWGTKWDVEAVLEEEGEDYLNYSFDSAWTPPIAWLKKVSADFPTLRFVLKYDEEGMGFFGRAIAQNGEVDDKWIE